jgi:hypothetical protein
VSAAPCRINVQDLPWNDLLAKVKQGECVPFIGAGTSYPVLPRAAQLAEQLLVEDEKATQRKYPLADRTDLARVCQYLGVTHNDGSWAKERIREMFRSGASPDFNDSTEPHRALANLKLPIYITTNYDDFMFRALKAAGASPRQEFARWTKALLDEEPSTFDEGYRPSASEPVVFHLHGHTGVYQSMVASEDDYLDFLVTISKEIAKSPKGSSEPTMLPLPIRSAIRNNRLLFVGYGLADINFRLILRGLVGSLAPSARQLHLSIQYAGGDPKELQDYMEDYFRWSLQLNVFWGSARDFTTELARRWSS